MDDIMRNLIKDTCIVISVMIFGCYFIIGIHAIIRKFKMRTAANGLPSVPSPNSRKKIGEEP